MLNNRSDDSLIRDILKQARIVKRPAEARKAERLAWDLPGVGPKVRILTSFGNLPIEALRRHDPVLTRSGQYLPVERVTKINLDAEFLDRHPLSRPVQIAFGALGRQTPGCETLFSPAQVVHLPGRNGTEASCSAVSLVGRQGIQRQAVSTFTYYSVHCGQDATVCADGLWIETAPRI